MNLGSIILNETTGELEIVDLGADAQVCPSRGVVVTHAKGEAMPEEAAKINEAFFGPEGLHGDDYSFFYYNIKANVAKRVAAYMANAKTSADLVVYGKIFTAASNQVVEAFAVKDGKYVYVGDKAGAEVFIEAGKTDVVDYTGKGLVMPGCGNGHAHYSIGVALPIVGTVAIGATPDKFMNELVPAAVKKAREANATGIFGFGWSYFTFGDQIPTRQQLDAICSDIPMYFADDEGHKGVANTLMLVNAGIMKADGTVLKKDKDIRGGEIVMGADGTPTGFLKEQAGTYTRSFLDNENLYPVDVAKIVIPKIQEHLLAEGYTMYIDGWGNYFFNDNFFKAAQQLDQAGELNFVIGLTYEVESWMNVEEALKKAADVQKYATIRVRTNWLKLFMDGTVEGGTGYVEPLYPDGHQGLANWTEEELTDITRKTNAQGISMHIHTMGNKAVNTVVSAYANGGKDELRNTLVHIRNVNAEDFQRMADHNMYAVSGMHWHHGPSWLADYIREHGMAPVGLEGQSYPMKSYFDNGINMTSHSDFPATSGSPDDPFGIIEIAVTGMLHGENGNPWWPEELVTREQAIEALTINIAKQMLIEKERGSVSVGKYADFLLVNKDVLTCPVTEIHEAKPAATYFEGKKVFSM
jgi:predicted amidohydrolase YtcJ